MKFGSSPTFIRLFAGVNLLLGLYIFVQVGFWPSFELAVLVLGIPGFVIFLKAIYRTEILKNGSAALLISRVTSIFLILGFLNIFLWQHYHLRLFSRERSPRTIKEAAAQEAGATNRVILLLPDEFQGPLEIEENPSSDRKAGFFDKEIMLSIPADGSVEVSPGFFKQTQSWMVIPFLKSGRIVRTSANSEDGFYPLFQSIETQDRAFYFFGRKKTAAYLEDIVWNRKGEVSVEELRTLLKNRGER